MATVNPDTLAALTAGIQSEVASYVFYLEASKKNEARQVKEMLEKLALEEKQHFIILERQFDSLVRSEKWISTADVLKQDGLPEISEEMNETHRSLIDEVTATTSLAAILDIAYRLEVEARDLFRDSSAKTDSPEARKVFDQLSRFEEGHMRLVNEMREKYA